MLFPDDLKGDAARAGIVEFDGENALPLPQLKFSPDDVQKNTGREEDSFAMTVTVYRFVWIHVDGADIEVVVHILRRAGRNAFKCFLDVSQEEWLGFLEDNCHSGMHGLDIDHTIFDAVFFDNGGNFFGNVDEVERCIGAQTDNVIDDFHRNSGRGE